MRCRELLDENGCLRHEIRGLREEKAGVKIQQRTEHVHKQVQKVERRVPALADTELVMPTIPPLLSPLVSRWKQQTQAKLSGHVGTSTLGLIEPLVAHELRQEEERTVALATQLHEAQTNEVLGFVCVCVCVCVCRTVTFWLWVGFFCCRKFRML